MRKFLALALLLGSALCAAAALPPEFDSYRVTPAGTVYFKASKAYSSPGKKEGIILNAWTAAVPANTEGLAVVELDGAGEAWGIKDGKASKLDSWSDKSMTFGPKTSRAGRWFGSFGMQSMGGGDHPSSALNLRFGSTLFKNRYDLAVSYDYNKAKDSILGQSSTGLVGRALLPLSRHGGWNIGAQFFSSDNYGDKESSVGLVTGLNVYLPQGSFDLTFNLREKGAYGFLVGYTVYITR